MANEIGDLYSEIPAQKATQEEQYVKIILDKISHFKQKHCSEEIYINLYKEVCRHQALENSQVDPRLVKAFQERVVGELPKINYSNLKFDKYSIIPLVKKKQYEENKKTLALYEEIENEKNPKTILNMYLNELKSAQAEGRIPDTKKMDMISSKKNRMVNSADVYVSTHLRKDSTTMANKRLNDTLDYNESVVKVLQGIPMTDIEYSKNGKKRTVQIQNRIDLVNFISKNKDWLNTNSVNSLSKLREERRKFFQNNALEGELYDYIQKRYKELLTYTQKVTQQNIERAKQEQNEALVEKLRNEFNKLREESEKQREWEAGISERNFNLGQEVREGNLNNV